jgi:hypothetical protein
LIISIEASSDAGYTLGMSDSLAKNREDSLWDALGGSSGQPDQKPTPNSKSPGRIRRRLEKAADHSVKAPTAFDTEHAAIVEWLQAYSGTFPFYVSLREQYNRRGELSEKQIASVYSAIEREKSFKAPKEATRASAKPHTALTLNVGERVRVSQFFAKKIGDEAGLTRAHFVFEVTEVLRETSKAYLVKLEAVSQRCSHCCVCGKSLTNPESVLKGIGPDCGDGYELDWKADRPALLQLAERLKTKASIVETWLPKSAIKERFAATP